MFFRLTRIKRKKLRNHICKRERQEQNFSFKSITMNKGVNRNNFFI